MSEKKFPIGQRIELPGHFSEPVVLEAVRALGAGYECRVRLPDGSLEEVVLSGEEAADLVRHPGATLRHYRVTSRASCLGSSAVFSQSSTRLATRPLGAWADSR